MLKTMFQLNKLLAFQAGNDFDEPFDELKYVKLPVIIINIKVAEPKFMFEPTLQDCRDLINFCFAEIVESGRGIPRVSRSRC